MPLGNPEAYLSGPMSLRALAEATQPFVEPARRVQTTSFTRAPAMQFVRTPAGSMGIPIPGTEGRQFTPTKQATPADSRRANALLDAMLGQQRLEAQESQFAKEHSLNEKMFGLREQQAQQESDLMQQILTGQGLGGGQAAANLSPIETQALTNQLQEQGTAPPARIPALLGGTSAQPFGGNMALNMAVPGIGAVNPILNAIQGDPTGPRVTAQQLTTQLQTADEATRPIVAAAVRRAVAADETLSDFLREERSRIERGLPERIPGISQVLAAIESQ